jgi:hypothetical protein
MSGGASFFLKEELADLLEELRLDVLTFIAGRTRTYGDEVASASETANAETTAASVATAAASPTAAAASRVTRRSVIVVATGGLGGDDPHKGSRQALQQDKPDVQRAVGPTGQCGRRTGVDGEESSYCRA